MSIATAPLALAHGVGWGSPAVVKGATHPSVPVHRPVIPPPVFVPPVVAFNPFVPAFVAATPIVVYTGALPPAVSVQRDAWHVPERSPTVAAPRAPGTGRWIVGPMPGRPAAPETRAHGGEPVLEIRRTSR
jgi:hypothetical protein